MAPWSTGPQVLSHSRSDVAALWAAICKRLLAPPKTDPATPADPYQPDRLPVNNSIRVLVCPSLPTQRSGPPPAIPGGGNDQLAVSPNSADRRQLSRESPELQLVLETGQRQDRRFQFHTPSRIQSLVHTETRDFQHHVFAFAKKQKPQDFLTDASHIQRQRKTIQSSETHSKTLHFVQPTPLIAGVVTAFAIANLGCLAAGIHLSKRTGRRVTSFTTLAHLTIRPLHTHVSSVPAGCILPKNAGTRCFFTAHGGRLPVSNQRCLMTRHHENPTCPDSRKIAMTPVFGRSFANATGS